MKGVNDMAKVSTSISIDYEVREKALPILNELGLDLSTAVGMFLRKTIRDQGIPFDVTLNVPNADTRAALQEFWDMKEHPEKYKRYRSFKDALQEALEDA